MTTTIDAETSVEIANVTDELRAIEAALAEADDGAQQTRLRLAAESRRRQVADMRRRMR